MLRGERVVLRPIEREDLPRLRDLVETPQVQALATSWHPIPPSLAEYEADVGPPEHRNAPGSVWFAVEGDAGEECGGELIGLCGLHGIEHLSRVCELGIRIGQPYWGKGFGQDAVRTLVDYAFRMLNMRKVSLDVLANDARAVGAYRAAGFREEGRRRAHTWYDGVYRDTLVMAVFREEPPPDTAPI
ncbi:MAG: GNAT family N-acetyltransferase [Actinomycetota bacterium]